MMKTAPNATADRKRLADEIVRVVGTSVGGLEHADLMAATKENDRSEFNLALLSVLRKGLIKLEEGKFTLPKAD